jgi:hypothetical protein
MDKLIERAIARRQLVDRFWSKIKVGKPDECWEWQAATNKRGYGHFKWNGKVKYSHRMSWILHNGKIPKGLFVCHTCDNPKCVNPAHLFLGTNQDNMDDMVNKGRASIKLTSDKVTEIRKRYATGNETYRGLADEYGVVYGMIGFIVRGENWKHI